jgi:hypothetical protein
LISSVRCRRNGLQLFDFHRSEVRRWLEKTAKSGKSVNFVPFSDLVQPAEAVGAGMSGPYNRRTYRSRAGLHATTLWGR